MDKWCPVCGNPVDITSGKDVFSCTHPTLPHRLTFNVYGVMVSYEKPVEVAEAPAPEPEQTKTPPTQNEDQPTKSKAPTTKITSVGS